METPGNLGCVGGRTRYRDSAGHARPVPLMLGLRIRLAPAWLCRCRRSWLITGTAVVLAAAVLAALPGRTAARAPCHQLGQVVSCR